MVTGVVYPSVACICDLCKDLNALVTTPVHPGVQQLREAEAEAAAADPFQLYFRR